MQNMPPKISQLPLKLIHSESYDLADFFIADCNRMAVENIMAWPNWPSHAAALVGPAASGKSHLAAVWLSRTGGKVIQMGNDISQISKEECILLDLSPFQQEQKPLDETWLFHLFNWVKETGGFLLILSRYPMNHLTISLPDLSSRLATVSTYTMDEPDDGTLTAVLFKMFSDKQLQVDLPVINYILSRTERSFQALKEMVAALDQIALAKKQKISIPLVREYIASPAYSASQDV
ncbi:hypothetical protein GCM10017044_23520 [Kordiimonas sediminis]|uniref:Hda lid domain-containing protein n=1 Tax=Kordiimonas sediminis TaxID=1735581 RepID=A0A919EA58_9PROT|nr:DnaA/Hda family protein [Kordiimonas sediminis]GHF27714.1 hypothetical protein GCM10017044_23520 [Kordiimonas sediminis]